MTISKEELKRWFTEEGRVGELRTGLEFIRRSGVLDLLRRAGLPVIINQGSDLNVMAGQAHFSAGYQMALDYLVNFEKWFDTDEISGLLGSPDFGSKEEALRAGNLKPEDFKGELT
jgi:hypothetical protein